MAPVLFISPYCHSTGNVDNMHIFLSQRLYTHYMYCLFQPIADPQSTAYLSIVEESMPQQVKDEVTSSQASGAATDTILTTSADAGVQAPVKRKRGRPPKVRSKIETVPVSGNSANMPESIGDAAHPQEEGLVSTTEDDVAHPMTLSLSPPPMPAGKVPQPAGVLLLPLYSSIPTEPGEQSSLMVVQPHQLANLPLALGGQVTGSGEPGAALPPLLTSTQPVVSPFSPLTSQSTLNVYTVPITASNTSNDEQA